MRSSWRRSTALVMALAVAMLLGLAGLASAEVTQVTVTSPTTTVPAYVKQGTVVPVTATVTATGDDEIYMKTGVGNCESDINFVHVGTGSGTYSCNVTITGSATEGWVNVSAQAYGTGGVVRAHTQVQAAFVDRQAPTIPGAFTNPTPTPGNDDTPTWSWNPSADQGDVEKQSGMDHYKVQIAHSTTSDTVGFGAWADANPATVAHPDSGNPAWTADPALAAGGWYKIRVCAVDKAGNESAYTGDSGVYQLDNAKPTAPGPATVSPSGPSNTDNTPEWSWSPSLDNEPNEAWQTGLHGTYAYKLEETQNGSVVSTYNLLSPEWKPTVTEGLHRVRVKAFDKVGNETSWVQGADYCYDLTAPIMGAFTNPTSPGTNKKPTWTWTASDGQYGSGIATTGGYTVDISLNGAPFAAAVPATVDEPSWSPSSDLASDGNYRIQVKVKDAAGNTSSGDTSGTYTLDSTPPEDVGTIGVPSPSPGNNKRPAWSWSRPSDGTGTGVSAYHVEISRDGDPYATVDPALVQTTAATAAWSPGADLADGKYKIRVRAQDAAGNQSAGWTAAATDYELDATKPVINTDSWDPVNDSWIGSSTYTVEVDITDPMGEGGTYSSGLNKGAGSLAINLSPAATVGTESWSGDTLQIPLSNLADLTEYTLKVDIKDHAGNAAVQGVLTFHVDLSGPTFSGKSPADGLETNDVDIQPQIGIADEGSGVDEDSIAWAVTGPGGPVSGGWTWDGTPASGVSTFVPGSVVVPEPLSTNGYYDLQVYAEDTVGNGSTYPESPATWKFLLDTVKPEVDIELNAYRDINSQIYTPRNGAAGRELVLTVTATDPGASPSGFNVSGELTVEVYDNEARTGTPITGSTTLNPNPRPSANTDPWTATWMPTGLLPDGKYYVRVIAIDDAGNGITDDTFTFIVDTQAPDIADNAAEVGFLNTSNNKRFTNSREIEVTWGKTLDPRAGNEPGSGLLGYKFEIHAKVEGASYNAADKLCDDYSDTDNVPELGVPVAYLKPTVGDTELWTAGPLGFETGKSYGAWIKAIDKVHNTSEWFDPPFIFDVDEPTAPQDAEIQGLKNALTDRRTNNSTPTLEWEHSTDIQVWAQSGVDLYEVQIDRAGAGTWDIRYVVDIEDEDVDKLNADDVQLSGTFTWTVPSKLEDGGYEVRVRAKDVAGNYSDWEFTEGFAIDATAPPVPGIPTATSPTNNQTPSWTWTLSPGAIGYNVYLDGEATPSALVPEPTSPDPMLFVHTTTLTEGVHHLQVTAVDDLGNESVKSGTGHVVIDLTKPDAPVMFGLKPFINGNWDDSVTLIWTAREDAVEYEVAYKIGATPDTKKVAVQTCVLDLGTPPITDGTVIEATVSARDAAGNWSDPSNKVSTTVDSQKPTVTQVAPIPSGRMKLTPTWTWSAQDGTGSQVSHYIVLLNGELLLETTSTSFKPASELDTGEYTLTVVAVDNVGNQSETNQGKFPTVTIDKQAPAVPGMPVTTSPTNNQTPTWTWKHISDGDLVKYNVYLDGSLKGSVNGPWSPGTTSIEWLTLENLGHGLHVLEVTSVDDLGNESAKSTQGHVMVDLVAPDVPTMNPMPAFSKQGSITFSWSASTDDLAVKYNFQYSTDNKATWNTRSGLTSQSAIVDASGLADGTKVYGRVMAYDAVLNDGGYSGDVYTTIDAVAPVVTDETTQGTPTKNATPTWTWSVVETGSGLDYFLVTLDAELPFRTTGASFTPSSRLTDGAHRLFVQGVDKVGNAGVATELKTVVVDTTPPAAPEMPVTTSPTNSQTPTWTWKHISDADLEKYNVYLDGSLKGSVVGPWLLGTTSIAWLTPEDLGHGLHVLEVTSVDDLGNESAKSTQGHVMVDLVAPDVPTMDPMPAFSKQGSITFSWSASTDDLAVKYNFQYSTDNKATWNMLSGLTSQSAIVDASGLADGTKVCGRVMAYDAVLNDDGYSDDVYSTIDAVAPVVAPETTPPARDNNATPTWEWSVTETGSGLDYFVVAFDSELPFRTTGTSFTPSSKLVDGEHELIVYGVDKAGNVGTPYTFPKVTIDTTPPAAPGMPVTTSPTKNTTPTWTWKHISDADLEKYNVYLDGSLKGSVVGPWLLGTTSIAWLTPEDLGHGLHVLEVTSVDDLGNESAKSTQGHVLVDLRAPEVPEMDPIAAWSKPGSIRFAWSVSHDDLVVEYNFQYSTDGGSTWATVSGLTGQSATVNASTLTDGTAVGGRVMAYDAVNNESAYSDAVCTMIDGTGPVVTITKPTAAVTTNAAEFKYEWTAVDGGCGVDYCTVLFNGGEHRVTATTGGGAYAWTGALIEGANTFEVWATDKLGNKSKVVAAAPIVTQVKPQIILGQPMQGTYKINEISTIAFQVIGLHDAVPEVRLNGELLDAWRIVTVVNSTTMAKFYVLLDGDVLVPGRLDVGIAVGKAEALYSYTVDSERSGFGFGRLRPW